MDHLMSRIVIAGLSTALLFLQVDAVSAGTLTYTTAYSTSAIVGTGGETDDEQHPGTGFSTASAHTDVSSDQPGFGILSTVGGSSAIAAAGIVGATADAAVQSTWTGTATFLTDNLAGSSASAYARFIIDDVIVSTDLEGVTSVPVSMFLKIGGSLGAGASLNRDLGWPAGSSGTATVTVGVDIAGTPFTGSRSYMIDNTLITGAVSASGLLAGADDLSTPMTSVPVNTPFQVELSIQVNAGATTNITHGNATATSSYGNTFSFATGGPVFDLPPGYTANSISGGIVGNQFAVPEPSSLVLAALGMAGMFCWRRLRVD